LGRTQGDVVSELELAIGELYDAFRPYRLGPDFTGCPHCVDDSESECLKSAALRDLGVDHLRRYATKAITTWGTATEFKHFAPRLLELAAIDPQDFLFLEVLFSKFEYASWRSWYPQEQQALERFFRSFWSSCLDQPADDSTSELADTALCALAQSHDTVAPFLEGWARHDSPSAPRHLAYFVIINSGSLAAKARLSNPFWKDRAMQAAQVREWLTQPGARKLLARGGTPAGSFNGHPLSDSTDLLSSWSGSAA